tara:strand:+ start:87 stop:275 length:189 start_codon:yes stop_codon:yes gene_type:complete
MSLGNVEKYTTLRGPDKAIDFLIGELHSLSKSKYLNRFERDEIECALNSLEYVTDYWRDNDN